MKIGIVSKPEHCKPHVRALEELNHQVVVLGSKDIDLPPSFDLIVCRAVSCSHQAFWDCSEAKREGRRVIFEESVTGIVTEVNRIEKEDKKMNVNSIMTDALMPSATTVERKLINAINELGCFHPKISVNDDQLTRLHALGLVRDIRKAKEAYTYVSFVKEGSWNRPFSAIRKSPKYHTYVFWKLSGIGGKKIKTPFEMISNRVLSERTQDRIAEIYELSRIEPTEGRCWPPLTVMPHIVRAQAAEVLAEPEVITPPVMSSDVDPDTTGIPLAAFVDEPQGEQVPEDPTPQQVQVREEEPKKPSPKADLKELISMLNDARIAANLSSLTIRLSEKGTEIEFEQIVVKRGNSLDDIE